jgi:uncharacterized protein
MGRLLVLVLIVVLAVWLIRRALRGPAQPMQKNPSTEQQDLVSCARCGVHLPRGEARSAGGQLYCGDEHARLGAGPG